MLSEQLGNSFQDKHELLGDIYCRSLIRSVRSVCHTSVCLLLDEFAWEKEHSYLQAVWTEVPTEERDAETQEKTEWDKIPPKDDVKSCVKPKQVKFLITSLSVKPFRAYIRESTCIQTHSPSVYPQCVFQGPAQPVCYSYTINTTRIHKR